MLNCRKARQTKWTLMFAFRNDVLRSKKVLIGCGGGFKNALSRTALLQNGLKKWT